METEGEVLGKVIVTALSAVDPVHLVCENVRLEGHHLFIKEHPIDLGQFRHIHALGVGKGATFLFEGLAHLLGNRIQGGIIISLPEHRFTHPRVSFFPGSHPIPDQTSLAAGQAVIDYIKNNIESDDLVLFLITGGASSLMVSPIEGISLEDKITVNQKLLECGAEINEINSVRKSLSALKGGKLAQMVYPAHLVSLIISDVIDSPLGDIGSGPSISQKLSFQQAYSVLSHYDIIQQLPQHLQDHLNSAAKNELKQKPPPLSETHPHISKNAHFLLADNRIALEEARLAAESQGIPAYILTSRDKGEAAEAAKLYAAIIKEIIYTGTPFKPPVILLCGGELTVTLTQNSTGTIGKGGRNQAFLMQLLKELKTVSHPYHIISIGSDGIDGPTDAAGAWIDQNTNTKVKEHSLSIDHYQRNHDSYHFFQELNQLIKTGPTHTNVMDLRIFYIPKRHT